MIALSIVCLIRSNVIDHFQVHLSLHIWVCLCVKSLLCLSVFIQTEIENYHNKNFALRETEGKLEMVYLQGYLEKSLK